MLKRNPHRWEGGQGDPHSSFPLRLLLWCVTRSSSQESLVSPPPGGSSSPAKEERPPKRHCGMFKWFSYAWGWANQAALLWGSGIKRPTLGCWFGPSSPGFPRGNSWKAMGTGTSLVVQWLRIHLGMQGTQVQSLVGELRSLMPQSNQA